MKCINCGSEIPQKAKFCPNCGRSIVVELKCANGHKMLPGQKFCCECGAQVHINEKQKERIVGSTASTQITDEASAQRYREQSVTEREKHPNNNFITKSIVTIIVLGIALAVINAIGGVQSYIIGGLCFVIIPNIWKFIDDM